VDPRRQLYWDLHDFSQGHGLEIGPLHRAMVHRSEGDVSYVDVQDRAGLLAHYAGDPHVPAEAIPEIDYTLIQPDGRTVSVADAAKAGAPFDWVMASHVIEHVPDVIGWLQDVGELVADDGVLVLAVPDRRFCFDVHRPPTTVGQMLQAHEAGDTRPSTRAIYDYFTTVVSYQADALWAGEVPDRSARIHTRAEAEGHVERSRDGQYVDCHVWLFTPESFLDQLHELRVSGHTPWFVEELVPTPRNDIEFRVVLRRRPRSADPTDAVPEEILPRLARPDWLPQAGGAPSVPALERRLARLERRLAKREATVARLRARGARRDRRIARQQRTIKQQRGQLAALRDSRQWRVGGALLAPVRLVSSRRGR
jgi:uncharacterized coiled-coil protein SlyX/SAM-dependent methyltransferase